MTRAAQTEGANLSELRAAVLEAIRKHGYRRFEAPIRLASGDLSHDFVDAKRGLARGEDLATACRALLELVDAEWGSDFEAVGGLTMGADQFAHGMALLGAKEWFVIRKAAKERGTKQRVEGAVLGPGMRCLVVEDVVTTGGSILEACDVAEEVGASVVAAVALVDRGEAASRRFAERRTPFRSLLSYKDLDIPPVGGS
jgi:orotate phosphoribosyltransferase